MILEPDFSVSLQRCTAVSLYCIRLCIVLDTSDNSTLPLFKIKLCSVALSVIERRTRTVPRPQLTRVEVRYKSVSGSS